MKKISVIILSIIMLVAIVAPCLTTTTVANAAEQDASAIYFVKPIATVVVNQKLYVADIVGGNKSVVWCFDVTQNSPNYLWRYEIADIVVNLSTSNNDLFVIYNNKVDMYTPSSSGTTAAETLGQATTLNVANVEDITHGLLHNPGGEDYPVLYFVKTNGSVGYHLFSNNTVGNVPINDFKAQPNDYVKGCVFEDDNLYVFGDNKAKLYRELDIPTADEYTPESDWKYTDFNDTEPLFNAQAKGMFFYKNSDNETKLAVFFAHGIYKVEHNVAERKYVTNSEMLNHSDQNIVDVATYTDGTNQYIFVLNNENTINKYQLNTDNSRFTLVDNYKIGSDLVKLDCPTTKQFTNYILAKPVGYPANIIYKTTSDTSVSEIIPAYEGEYIIFDYEGAQDDPYYYVLASITNPDGTTSYKYGWVIKSDEVRNQMNPQQDSKLSIVNTSVSGDLSYNAKFNSLNGVFVYSMPLSNSEQTSFSQTASALTSVTILQQFTEIINGETKYWYYVKYSDDNGFIHTGFIPKSQVSYITAVSTNDNTIVGEMKINAELFDKVYLLDNDGNVAVDADGKQVVLFSGDIVKVVKNDDSTGKSLVQVIDENGNFVYGYINTANLMGRMELSNNAILGLSVLGVAIVLMIVFAFVFLRKKTT